MQSLSPTKKLFHAVVVLGMAASAGGCSTSSTGTGQTGDASASNDASGSGDSSSADSATMSDGGTAMDSAAGDAFHGWLGC